MFPSDPGWTRRLPRRPGILGELQGGQTPQPPEVARLLGVKLKTLANWRSNPRGPGPKYRRIGNRIHYPQTLLERWMEDNLHASTADYPDAVPAPAEPLPANAEDLDATIDDLVRRLAEAQTERAKRQAAGLQGSPPNGPTRPGPRRRKGR